MREAWNTEQVWQRWLAEYHEKHPKPEQTVDAIANITFLSVKDSNAHSESSRIGDNDSEQSTDLVFDRDCFSMVRAFEQLHSSKGKPHPICETVCCSSECSFLYPTASVSNATTSIRLKSS